MSLKKLFKKVNSIVEYPELLKTINKQIDRKFIKSLLDVKQKLDIAPLTILDIGAATGVWSQAARQVFPLAKIYAFEPIKDSFIKLEAKMKSDPNFHAFNFALSNKNSKVFFNLNASPDSSSILKMTEDHKNEFPHTKDETHFEIETFRLDSIKSVAVEEPALMKMDVQGAELLVLIGAENILNRFSAVQMEINFENFYESQPTYNEVFNFMYSHNFKRFFQAGLLESNKNGKILACDIVFLR